MILEYFELYRKAAKTIQTVPLYSAPRVMGFASELAREEILAGPSPRMACAFPELPPCFIFRHAVSFAILTISPFALTARKLRGKFVAQF